MHIVSGELRKKPFIKHGVGKDGQSTLFIVDLSEMTKDYQTGEKSYTNYSAALFAKSQGHIDYYNSALVEGNFIVVNCEKLKIKVSDCGKYTTLDMENARLENSKYIAPDNAPQGQQRPAQQQQPQQSYQNKQYSGQSSPSDPQPQFQQQAQSTPMSEPDFDCPPF